MFSSLRQFIAASLLLVLACSCSGLSFGMIGHGFMQMNGIEHGAVETHDCCAVVDVSEAAGTEAAGIDHHVPAVATLLYIDLLIALFVVFAGVILPVSTLRKVVSRIQLYARNWLERLSYFALYITQLFSRGVLHPKTW